MTDCKGIVARYTKNCYFNGRDIVQKEAYSILKRKSCSGCEKCGWILEAIQEECGLENNIPAPRTILYDGDLVQFKLVCNGTDYETGVCDDWCIEAIKIGTAFD